LGGKENAWATEIPEVAKDTVRGKDLKRSCEANIRLVTAGLFKD